MSVWLVQIHKISIQNGISAGYIAMKIAEIFKCLANEFGIADAILMVGYNALGRVYDK